MERYWNPIETAPIHELRALQSLRLSQTVRHVYEHVPFYRKKFDEMGLKPEDIQSIDDISKLPFTYKQDLRDNYPYGLFAVPVEDLARIHASSGTTGKQTVVGYTQNDIKIWGNCCGRALTAAGADVLVSGSAFFSHPPFAERLAVFEAAAAGFTHAGSDPS